MFWRAIPGQAWAPEAAAATAATTWAGGGGGRGGCWATALMNEVVLVPAGGADCWPEVDVAGACEEEEEEESEATASCCWLGAWFWATAWLCRCCCMDEGAGWPGEEPAIAVDVWRLLGGWLDETEEPDGGPCGLPAWPPALLLAACMSV